MAFVQFDGVQQILAEVDFSTFEECQYLAARSLTNLYLNVRIALRVAMQEL